jgi:hypothetical protein
VILIKRFVALLVICHSALRVLLLALKRRSREQKFTHFYGTQFIYLIRSILYQSVIVRRPEVATKREEKGEQGRFEAIKLHSTVFSSNFSLVSGSILHELSRSNIVCELWKQQKLSSFNTREIHDKFGIYVENRERLDFI